MICGSADVKQLFLPLAITVVRGNNRNTKSLHFLHESLAMFLFNLNKGLRGDSREGVRVLDHPIVESYSNKQNTYG